MRTEKVVFATHPAPVLDLFNQKLDGTAWKSKPSWYIVARNDRTVQPELQRFAAKRMGATIYETDSSHVRMLSQPSVVLDVIRAAATVIRGFAVGVHNRVGADADSLHVAIHPLLLAQATVTLRIERTWAAGRVVIRLTGRMQAEFLPDLQKEIEETEPKPDLDLQEVALVDVEAVRFLITCNENGVALLHCSPYIRRWMARERPR